MENKEQILADYIDEIGDKHVELRKEFKKITGTFTALSVVLASIAAVLLYITFVRISTMGFTKISLVAIWVLFTLMMIFMALESSIRAMRKAKDFVDNVTKSYQEIAAQNRRTPTHPTLPEIKKDE